MMASKRFLANLAETVEHIRMQQRQAAARLEVVDERIANGDEASTDWLTRLDSDDIDVALSRSVSADDRLRAIIRVAEAAQNGASDRVLRELADGVFAAVGQTRPSL